MKATLCEQTLENAAKAYPALRGAILHSDRGTQYASELYRKAINKYGILQSMNSVGKELRKAIEAGDLLVSGGVQASSDKLRSSYSVMSE